MGRKLRGLEAGSDAWFLGALGLGSFRVYYLDWVARFGPNWIIAVLNLEYRYCTLRELEALS